jgi:hypothetical protein
MMGMRESRAGLWYIAAKKARGQNTDCVMGRALVDQNSQIIKEQRFDFPHEVMDGAGALLKFFKELGCESVPVPEMRGDKPGLFKRFFLMFKALGAIAVTSVSWKRREAKGAEQHYLKVVEQDSMARLRKWTRDQGASLNAYLLRELQTALTPYLNNPEESLPWLFPINMRGAFPELSLQTNQSSFLPLSISPQTSPALIHQNIKDALAADLHFAIWDFHNLLSRLGEKVRIYLSNRSYSRSFWMGTYSDVGEWRTNGAYEALGPGEIWYALPPGSRNYPVSFTHITVNGRTAFCLRIHPSLGLSSDEGRLILERVINQMIAQLSV